MTTPQLYKTTGIILKRTNWGEGDKTLTVLCSHIGKKRFIGKGIRKISSRRASHLELFSQTEFLIHKGKVYDYVTGATIIHAYGSSYGNLKQIAVAYTACEVIDRLIMEGQEHDEAFYVLQRVLTDIEYESGQPIAQRLSLFIDELLVMLGYKRKEAVSRSLGEALGGVERIIERRIRSATLLAKSGIDISERFVPRVA